MSEQTIGLSRSVDARATLPWLVAAAVYLLLMALGSPGWQRVYANDIAVI